MQTFFDWVTVGLFLGIAGLFFYRNQFREENIFLYLLPSVACAVANQLGNRGAAGAAFVLIAAVVGFLLWAASRPLGKGESDSGGRG